MSSTNVRHPIEKAKTSHRTRTQETTQTNLTVNLINRKRMTRTTKRRMMRKTWSTYRLEPLQLAKMTNYLFFNLCVFCHHAYLLYCDEVFCFFLPLLCFFRLYLYSPCKLVSFPFRRQKLNRIQIKCHVSVNCIRTPQV